MQLDSKPQIVEWPKTTYVFQERRGIFSEVALHAWRDFSIQLKKLENQHRVGGVTALFKLEPELLYRTCAAIKDNAKDLPEEMKRETFGGGKYAKFTLTGPYADLPKAWEKASQVVAEMELRKRPDYHIENYLNDPETTPPEQLKTELLIPIN